MRNVPVRLLILSLFVSGLCQCSYFKIFRNDIRQGNAIEEGNLNKLYKGMPKSQVSKIMGTPALIPRLDTDKWVYTYYLIPGDDKPREEKKLVLNFSNSTLQTYAGTVSIPKLKKIND
ncbi:MAG: outer membrane protein assembly factor BamE [Francisellaceae bacterium]|jgi:outer membrane protein assembly factor BamE|nr:outer membrane protein assembly factor BamE [Francisellaceae bacterium]MBT6208072.1 outer membrane protein assembly factor BamE [Francisellaceae bacterium]MBT6538790.1 outer membrane protein assembly factor BamE [Francisellaceae bacterium]